MRNLLASVLFCGSIALAACGGSKESAKIKEYKSIVKETCACTDAACAKAADKKEQDWRMETYKSLSQGDKDSMKNARQEFTKCRDKLAKE